MDTKGDVGRVSKQIEYFSLFSLRTHNVGKESKIKVTSGNEVIGNHQIWNANIVQVSCSQWQPKQFLSQNIEGTEKWGGRSSSKVVKKNYEGERYNF